MWMWRLASVVGRDVGTYVGAACAAYDGRGGGDDEVHRGRLVGGARHEQARQCGAAGAAARPAGAYTGPLFSST